MGNRPFVSPWVRAVITPDQRRAASNMPDLYQAALYGDSANGPWMATVHRFADKTWHEVGRFKTRDLDDVITWAVKQAAVDEKLREVNGDV